MMSKQPAEAGGHVNVPFVLPVNEDRPRASDAGLFNEGNPEASPPPPLSPQRAVSVRLAAGWRYSFRHLDGNWRNDEAADNYIPKLSGGRDGIVDLSTST